MLSPILRGRASLSEQDLLLCSWSLARLRSPEGGPKGGRNARRLTSLWRRMRPGEHRHHDAHVRESIPFAQAGRTRHADPKSLSASWVLSTAIEGLCCVYMPTGDAWSDAGCQAHDTRIAYADSSQPETGSPLRLNPLAL